MNDGALRRNLRTVFLPRGSLRKPRPLRAVGACVFSAAKDLMTSKAAKAYANNLISRYGRVAELEIDSKRHRIDVRCELNGEVSSIGVTIEKYLVETANGKTFITVLDSSATRPWLQAVMRDHLHGRRFELPPWAASAL